MGGGVKSGVVSDSGDRADEVGSGTEEAAQEKHTWGINKKCVTNFRHLKKLYICLFK